MQILKDIYKLCGEEYRAIPNVFAIRNQDSLILIDCGTNESDWNIVRKNMEYWGISDLPITHVLITHAHGDHVGNAAMLQKKGAQIYVGQAATSVEDAEDPLNFHYAYPSEFQPFIPDQYVKDGDVLEIGSLCFTCIEAPGHSIGDVCYLVEMYGKKILFLGDVFHIGEYGSRAWIGYQWFLGSDYDAYMRSLYKLMHVHADVLLSAHMQGCLCDADFIKRDAFIQAEEKFDGRWDKRSFLKELGVKR